MLVHVGGTADEAAATASRIIARSPDDPNVTVARAALYGVRRRSGPRSNTISSSARASRCPSRSPYWSSFRRSRRRIPTRDRRNQLDRLHAVGVAAHDEDHRCVGARTHGCDRVRPRVVHRLRLADGVAIPRGTRQRKDRHQAIIATVTTAGRTILFSAATVTLAMTGLLVFPTYFCDPSALPRPPPSRCRHSARSLSCPPCWLCSGSASTHLRSSAERYRFRPIPYSGDVSAQAVTRRPLFYALPVVAVLLELGIPFLSAQYATPDERALPTDSNARLVSESLQKDFQLDPSQAITLVTRTDTGVLESAAEVSAHGRRGVVSGPIGR